MMTPFERVQYFYPAEIFNSLVVIKIRSSMD